MRSRQNVPPSSWPYVEKAARARRVPAPKHCRLVQLVERHQPDHVSIEVCQVKSTSPQRQRDRRRWESSCALLREPQDRRTIRFEDELVNNLTGPAGNFGDRPLVLDLLCGICALFIISS